MSGRTMQVWKHFKFEAAHRLPRVCLTHKCRQLHGHSYRVTVWCRAVLDPDMEWVVDFGEISAAWLPLRELLDHSCLNEVPGLENPTAENVAAWIFRRMGERLPSIHRVQVQETEDCGAECWA